MDIFVSYIYIYIYIYKQLQTNTCLHDIWFYLKFWMHIPSLPTPKHCLNSPEVYPCQKSATNKTLSLIRTSNMLYLLSVQLKVTLFTVTLLLHLECSTPHDVTAIRPENNAVTVQAHGRFIWLKSTYKCFSDLVVPSQLVAVLYSSLNV